MAIISRKEDLNSFSLSASSLARVNSALSRVRWPEAPGFREFNLSFLQPLVDGHYSMSAVKGLEMKVISPFLDPIHRQFHGCITGNYDGNSFGIAVPGWFQAGQCLFHQAASHLAIPGHSYPFLDLAQTVLEIFRCFHFVTLAAARPGNALANAGFIIDNQNPAFVIHTHPGAHPIISFEAARC